jgi:site-specific recombinase XerD
LVHLVAQQADGQPIFELLIRGKGDKERKAYLENGAAQALSDWLVVRGSDPGPVFCRVRKGGRVITGDGLSGEAMRLILEGRQKEAGLAPLTWHDFRRTFVGDLLDDGVDLATVQALAGHADPGTTSRYDRRGEESKRRAARKRFVPYHKMVLGDAQE